MNATTDTTIPAIGTLIEGGFFAGVINVDGQRFGLVAAPKFDGEHDDIAWNGEHDDIAWNGDYKRVAGAKSYCDGLANTEAMAADGSEVAKWARGLRIAGLDDWYLPAQDELEICYRTFKPTKEGNSPYGRSGINVSAEPATYPYTETTPMQTIVEAFKEGGADAFDDDSWYWSSTQHAGIGGYAWCQGFTDGFQHGGLKDGQLRARAVRRFAL